MRVMKWNSWGEGGGTQQSLQIGEPLESKFAHKQEC